MTKEETENLIDEIIGNSKGYSWNFIKTTSTTVDFGNYLKIKKLEESIDFFGVNSDKELIIDEVINWTKDQLDTDENPIYSQDTIIKLETISQDDSKYWLIFFRSR